MYLTLKLMVVNCVSSDWADVLYVGLKSSFILRLLCNGEGDHAYIVYDPTLDGKKDLKHFKRSAGTET